MKMKKSVYLITFLLVAGICNPIHAEDTVKIGFIRTQRVILETQAGKEGYATLQSLVDQHRQKMTEKENEIKKMEDELAKQSQMLTDEARLEHRERLQRAVLDLNRMKEDAQTEIGNREKLLLDRIIDQLADIIEKIGKEQGFTIILDADGPSVLYTDTALDISNLVIAEFDKTSTQ
jgi:outer membrane protein